MRRRPARALSDSLEARVLLSTAMPAFDAAEPTGSMAYRSTAFGTAAAGAESGRYTFSAGAGQKLAVAVAPLTSPGLDVGVELRDPAGNVVATSSGQGAGVTEIIQPVGAPSPGQYEVAVQPVSGSGTFRLDVMLGSLIEVEGAADGNDSPAAAQDIGGSFTDLGGGASRGAVAGAVADAVTLNGNAESFESGTLGPTFATTVTGSGTGAQVIPIAYDNPNKVLWLHGDYDRATGGLVEVVWTVSLTGATDANLTFRASHSFNDFT
jgi:hypothetical protein